jgi:hypothetical protein
MLFFVVQILPMESGICSGTVSGGIPLSSPHGRVYGVFQSEYRIPFTQYLGYSKKTAHVTTKENNV